MSFSFEETHVITGSGHPHDCILFWLVGAPSSDKTHQELGISDPTFIMRLRVRVRRQTSRIELQGEDPSLTELIQVVRDTVLTAHGLSTETHFSLSLNGSELLTDSGQTLSTCGIVSGDLVSVVIPETPSGSNAQIQSNTSTQSHTHTQSTAQSAEQGSIISDSHSNTLSQVSEFSAIGSSPGGSPGPRASSWEPMLCSEAEEGHVPLSLELLYHSAQTRTCSDALMVAVHLLMMETGFVSEDSQLKPPQMPPGWNSPAGAYKLQYSHPQCGGSVVRLVAVSMGPVLAVQPHLSISGGGSSTSSSSNSQQSDSLERLCVNPSSYITLQPEGNAGEVFRDLRKLSRLFKDQLIYPLIAAAREAMSLPVLFGLAVLPPELLLRILRLLDVPSLLRLSSVCSHLHQVAADSTLWRHLYRRDFPESDSDRPRDTDWKELYKRSFKLRCDLRRPRHCSLPPFHRNPRSMLPHPPSFPLVPGIIGGEYDQRPTLPHGFLPRPRYDPLGPLGDPDRMPPPLDLRVGQPPGGRGSSDIRRGFI